MSQGNTDPIEQQLARAVRVSDQLCTGYAVLRDRYKEWATAMDLIILALSAWLSALSFVSNEIAVVVTPHGLSKDLWQGLLSTFVFVCSLVQLQVNWKGRAQLYQQAVLSLSSFVKESRPLIAQPEPNAIRSALLKYQTVTDSIEPIPEASFLALKRRHRIKLVLSDLLDKRPGASIWVLKLQVWFRDTFQK